MTKPSPEKTNAQLLQEIDEIRLTFGFEDPLPGELRWTTDWLSADLQMLSLEARGLYGELLTQAWTTTARLRRTSEDELRRLVRADPEEWARAWPKISRYWAEEQDVLLKIPVLVNRQQLSYYLDSIRSRSARFVAAKKGASASVEARRNRPARPPRAAAVKAQSSSSGPILAPPPGGPEPRQLVPPCPECSGPLERKARSTSGNGQRHPPGWYCRQQRQGFPLTDSRIYGGLSPAARESVDIALKEHAEFEKRDAATQAESTNRPTPRIPKAPAAAANAAGLDALKRAQI